MYYLLFLTIRGLFWSLAFSSKPNSVGDDRLNSEDLFPSTQSPFTFNLHDEDNFPLITRTHLGKSSFSSNKGSIFFFGIYIIRKSQIYIAKQKDN